MWRPNPELLRSLQVFAEVLLHLAGGAVACAAAAGFLGRFHWYLDLASHFAVYYFLGFSIVMLGFLALRFWKTAAVYGAGVLLHGLLLLPYYSPRGDAPAGPVHELRILMMNVDRFNPQHHLAIRTVSAHDPDVVVVTELHRAWMDSFQDLRALYPYWIAQSQEDCFGIGLFSKRQISEGKIVELAAPWFPSIHTEIEIGNRSVHLLAAHPPAPVNAEWSRLRNACFEAATAFLSPLEGPVLLAGDFNVTPWNAHFRALIRDTGLRDSARGWGIANTWPTHHKVIRIPIDHCLHSEELYVTARKVCAPIGSDHLPVLVDFVLPAQRAPAATGH